MASTRSTCRGVDAVAPLGQFIYFQVRRHLRIEESKLQVQPYEVSHPERYVYKAVILNI